MIQELLLLQKRLRMSVKRLERCFQVTHCVSLCFFGRPHLIDELFGQDCRLDLILQQVTTWHEIALNNPLICFVAAIGLLDLNTFSRLSAIKAGPLQLPRLEHHLHLRVQVLRELQIYFSLLRHDT